MSDVESVPWEDSSDLVATEFKCTKCNCHGINYAETEEVEKIMEQGYGLAIRYRICIDNTCYCHTGAGKPVRILARETTLGMFSNG